MLDAWAKSILLQADEVIITAAPDLANLRNAKSIVDLLKQARRNDNKPRLVMNMVNMPKRPEISVKEFETALDLKADQRHRLRRGDVRPGRQQRPDDRGAQRQGEVGVGLPRHRPGHDAPPRDAGGEEVVAAGAAARKVEDQAVRVRQMFGKRTTTITAPRPPQQPAAPMPRRQSRPSPSRRASASPSAAAVAAQDAQRRHSEEYYDVKTTVFNALIDTIDLTQLAKLDAASAREEIRDIVSEIIQIKNVVMSIAEQEELLEDICNDVLGYGPLEPLLARDEIADIMVNGANTTYIEVGGKVQKTGVRFADNLQLMNICQRIVSQVGRRVDESSPICDARLPDGSRVNVIAPPLAIDGPVLTIRKFKSDRLNLEQLVKIGTITPYDAKPSSRSSVACAATCLISGGTGSGKTTLLNCLTGSIDDDERIITCEDSAELQLQQPHVVRLETRPPNLEGEGEIKMRDLVRNCLRMRPERIIVGEVRGPEAFDLLQAMNTGHDGSMGTLHCNSPREAISRLEVDDHDGRLSAARAHDPRDDHRLGRHHRAGGASARRHAQGDARHRGAGHGRRRRHAAEPDSLRDHRRGRSTASILGRQRSTGIARPHFWDRALYYGEEGRSPERWRGRGARRQRQSAGRHQCLRVISRIFRRRPARRVGGRARSCSCLLYPYVSGERQTESATGRRRTQSGTRWPRARARQPHSGASRRRHVARTWRTARRRRRRSRCGCACSVPASTSRREGLLAVQRRSAGWSLAVRVICASALERHAHVSDRRRGDHRRIRRAPLVRQQAHACGARCKFLAELANAIDIVVRGVKSGLPLNECLATIARESAEPLASEFRDVVEQQRVGVSLSEALETLTPRMPLAEVKFLAIVIAIQQQAGGNLSEALGNLAGVLRDRFRLKMKVAALSAEAKASAMVLASLPPAVMFMVYWRPHRLHHAVLFNTRTGNFALLFCGVLDADGRPVMRKMINFKF